MALTDQELLDTFDERLSTYVAEHPDCQEAELLTYAALLPGGAWV